MNNDLISRSELLEELRNFYMNITGLTNAMAFTIVDECKKSFCKIVEEQPTAYDVDKVVEHLKLHKDCYERKAAEHDERGDMLNMDISDLISLAYGKVIEIAKAGERDGGN